MSSTWTEADLSTPARMRLAAVELFADKGFDRTTVRAIAERAGVSPGLVIHHFGSKDGLRQACDDWVLAFIEDEKLDFIRGGSLPQMQVYLAEHPELAPMMAYIVSALRHGGDLAQSIFDRMCKATETMYDDGLPAYLNDPSDREASIVTLVAFSAGASLLGPLIAKRLGGETLLDPAVYSRYALASVELLTRGLFSDDRFLEATKASVAFPSPQEI